MARYREEARQADEKLSRPGGLIVILSFEAAEVVAMRGERREWGFFRTSVGKPPRRWGLGAIVGAEERKISTPFLAPVYVSGPPGAKAGCSYRVTGAERGDYERFSWGSACHNNATDETTSEPLGTNDKPVRRVFWRTGRANWG
jgi:hypothetical protein